MAAFALRAARLRRVGIALREAVPKAVFFCPAGGAPAAGSSLRGPHAARVRIQRGEPKLFDSVLSRYGSPLWTPQSFGNRYELVAPKGATSR